MVFCAWLRARVLVLAGAAAQSDLDLTGKSFAGCVNPVQGPDPGAGGKLFECNTQPCPEYSW